jgi:predicted nucleotidyltransferase
LIHTKISGLREVYEAAIEEVNFEGSYRFKVATLAGIVILKLISYDDRPEIRRGVKRYWSNN